MNLPLAVALHLGLKMGVTDPNCKEEVKSVKHNRLMLKGIAVADVVMAVILFIVSLC